MLRVSHISANSSLLSRKKWTDLILRPKHRWLEPAHHCRLGLYLSQHSPLQTWSIYLPTLTTANLVYIYLSQHSPLQTWSICLPTLTTADLVYTSPDTHHCRLGLYLSQQDRLQHQWSCHTDISLQSCQLSEKHHLLCPARKTYNTQHTCACIIIYNYIRESVDSG